MNKEEAERRKNLLTSTHEILSKENQSIVKKFRREYLF